MDSIFQPSGNKNIIDRINRLTPQSAAGWGKMDVAQMLTHVRMAMEVPLERHQLNKSFMMKIIGPMIRKSLLADKPVKRNSPTAPTLRVADTKDFDQEKQQLLTTIQDFMICRQKNKLPERHPYFGKMTPDEWGMFQTIHLNHHLTQFGV